MNQTIDTAPIGAASLVAARRVQRRRMLRIFGVFVALPTLVVAIYATFVQTRFYESVATLSVEPVGGATLEGRRDAVFLRDYARSHDALAYLVDHEHYREHFGARWIDFRSRLDRGAPNEAAFEHYERHVNVDVDAETGFILLRVRAHTGGDAQRFARALIRAMSSRAESLGRDPAQPSAPTRRLAIVANATRPDVASGPKPLRSIATTLFGTIALLIVLSIVISTAREHADV